jgi:chaperone BCS1
MKQFLNEETEKKYNLLGIPYKKNYLFEGLPGTGKTSLIYAIASELNLDIAILSFKRDFDDVKFMKAVQHIPENTLLILEDIDVLFQERKNNDDHKHGITFSGLLNVLDGLGHQDKLITIMTTNYKNRLDKALVRPGRIDYSLHFDYSTKEQIKHMFFRFFPGKDEECTTFLSYFKKYKIKLTTAILQQYLFTNMNKKSIMDDINTLEELIALNNYQDKPDGLYN